MGFWLLLAMWAATFVIGELIRPKPEFENAKPSGLGDFSFPTATEGRCVPLLWGRAKTDGPNVIWYGAYSRLPIEEKVKTGMFSSEKLILGYAYLIAIQFGICRGPGVKLYAIYIGDKLRENFEWADGLESGQSTFVRVPGKPDPCHYLYQEKLSGNVDFYGGNLDQAINDVVDYWQDDASAYRGTCHAVFHTSQFGSKKGGYVGTSTAILAWGFDVSRIPDGLSLATEVPGAEEPHQYDANPMNVIYEILTDTKWGLGVSSSLIDLANFRAAASTLYDEEHGFSMIMDTEREATDMIEEVCEQIDGTLFFNREVGLWQIALSRDDYVVGDLDIYDEDVISELISFARTSWQETTNQVRVKFHDRDNSYQETYAMAQDTANMIMQDATVAVDISFPGVKYAALANKLAWRELSTLSYPLSKIEFTVNRVGFSLTPGAVFKFSWARLGISEVVFRVSRIDYGEIDDGKITVYAIQDIFAAGTGVFSDPTGTGWTEPDPQPDPSVAADTLIFEAPRQMVAQDPYDSSLEPRLFMGARSPGDEYSVGFEAWYRIGTSQPITGDFEQDADVMAFLLQGTLETALTAYPSSVRPATSYVIRVNDLDPDDLSFLEVSGTAANVASLSHILKIDDEYIGYEIVGAPSGGVVQIQNIYRGLFNSVPAAHAVNAKVWFLGQQSGGNLNQFVFPTGYDEADIQLRTTTREFTVEEADTPIIDAPTLTTGWRRPLPPRDPELHGGFAPATATADTQYTTETGLTGDDARGIKVEVTPRSWRIDEVLEDHILSGSPTTLADDNTEFDYWLTLDPSGTPVDTEMWNETANPDTPVGIILRNAIIVAVGANASIPSTATLKVRATHWPSLYTQLSADQDMEHTFTLTSSLQSADDLTFGGLTKDLASASVVVGETGTYTFDIKNALPSSGIVEININGGGWEATPLVAAGASSGTWSLTSGDSIQLRFTQYPANDQFFDVTGPTAELGYGVLQAL